jgi:hypothetical protein
MEGLKEKELRTTKRCYEKVISDKRSVELLKANEI